MEQKFIGIDLGTQGVRGAAVTESGEILGYCSQPYACLNAAENSAYKEQNPQDWWEALCAVLRALSKIAPDAAALSIDGTSGTILALDGNCNSLGNAIMYNDPRAGEQAARLSSLAADHQRRHGYRFNSSFALPKILWCIENNIPAARYVHQTDYILGKLTGIYDVTDFSNALKTGYDLIDECWPDFVRQAVAPLPLPQVVPCGSVIGKISNCASQITGLRPQTLVCAGATDGYASSLAACAVRPGDWASIIGTTLILKGVSAQLIPDPQGRIYSHKHPQGWWMPGGASNVGGRCLNEWFGSENFDRLNSRACQAAPSGKLVYPLLSPGERFPFVDPAFPGFCPPDFSSQEQRYAAVLEGVGYAERMCYDLLADLGCSVSQSIYTAGGACKSPAWLQIRANILNKSLKIPQAADAAVGSAMLSASVLHFGSLTAAVSQMGRIKTIVEPEPQKAKIYDELYQQFVQETNNLRSIT